MVNFLTIAIELEMYRDVILTTIRIPTACGFDGSASSLFVTAENWLGKWYLKRLLDMAEGNRKRNNNLVYMYHFCCLNWSVLVGQNLSPISTHRSTPLRALHGDLDHLHGLPRVVLNRGHLGDLLHQVVASSWQNRSGRSELWKNWLVSYWSLLWLWIQNDIKLHSRIVIILMTSVTSQRKREKPKRSATSPRLPPPLFRRPDVLKEWSDRTSWGSCCCSRWWRIGSRQSLVVPCLPWRAYLKGPIKTHVQKHFGILGNMLTKKEEEEKKKEASSPSFWSQVTRFISQFRSKLILNVSALVPSSHLATAQDLKLPGRGAPSARARALGVLGVGTPKLAHEIGDHPVEVDSILSARKKTLL